MNKEIIEKNIIEELGLQDLPPETQINLLTQMTESVLKRITVQVLERLSDTERDEFAKLQEAGDADQVDEFLKTKIPNYEQMLKDEVGNFKEEMKSTVDMLKRS